MSVKSVFHQLVSLSAMEFAKTWAYLVHVGQQPHWRTAGITLATVTVVRHTMDFHCGLHDWSCAVSSSPVHLCSFGGGFGWRNVVLSGSTDLGVAVLPLRPSNSSPLDPVSLWMWPELCSSHIWRVFFGFQTCLESHFCWVGNQEWCSKAFWGTQNTLQMWPEYSFSHVLRGSS